MNQQMIPAFSRITKKKTQNRKLKTDLFDLVGLPGMDKRTMRDTVSKTGTDLELGNLVGELLGKLVVDGVMDVDPVGTDASLT